VAHASFSATLSLVRRTYAAAAPSVRAHALGRFLTCPFLPVLAALPPGARLLDIGAGHGTFARLAVEWGAASATAVEPDLRKVLATYRHPRVRFVAGYAETLAHTLADTGPATGTFGVVSLLDVLYRIPLAGWDPLLRQAFLQLAPGGVLLLKEIDPGQRGKALWNRTQEKLATLLGMTLGDAFTYETRNQIRDRLTRLGFEAFAAQDIGRWYPHAHVLYTARRPLVE
jgi:2-polyprenyl-3-methyl-5-hydroxy-6-metoxy-1,4-benzoquinol methylase